MCSLQVGAGHPSDHAESSGGCVSGQWMEKPPALRCILQQAPHSPGGGGGHWVLAAAGAAGPGPWQSCLETPLGQSLVGRGKGGDRGGGSSQQVACNRIQVHRLRRRRALKRWSLPVVPAVHGRDGPLPAWPAPGATRARPRGRPCCCPAPRTGDSSAAAAPRRRRPPAWRPSGGEGRPHSDGLGGGFPAPPPPRGPRRASSRDQPHRSLCTAGPSSGTCWK